MSKTSDDSLLGAGAGDKIVLFEFIYCSLAILTFVEKHLVKKSCFFNNCLQCSMKNMTVRFWQYYRMKGVFQSSLMLFLASFTGGSSKLLFTSKDLAYLFYRPVCMKAYT